MSYSLLVELDGVTEPPMDVELLESTSKPDSLEDSMVLSAGIELEGSISFGTSELELTSSVNISVERKIPKNTEPKIDAVTIVIDFADIYLVTIFFNLSPHKVKTFHLL